MASELVFGFDIGTTSIGSAVIRMDSQADQGEILHLGVRIFPEARDPKGVPLNQERRAKRMARRQLRRRKQRRMALNSLLSEAGMLPAFSKDKFSPWGMAMLTNPWDVRARALQEPLTDHELGRALYHLAQRRHFRGRDLETPGGAADAPEAVSAEEKQAASQRDTDRKALRESGQTLGAFLAEIPDQAGRRRGHHFAREDVHAEFRALVRAQAPHHPALANPDFQTALEESTFAQRPVFWRKATLGACRFVPGAELAASASWLAQEKRMLEKLNNLRIEAGNGRPLDEHERAAILTLLRQQDSVSWGGIRRHLKLYWRSHDQPEKSIFNLERGGEKGLVGNRLENRLAAIMGERWLAEPALREQLRAQLHDRLYATDYGHVAGRIVIRREAERRAERARERNRLQADFDLTDAQADALAGLTFASGWEPFSTEALQRFLPRLRDGTPFGALLASPDEAGWRAEQFPDREQPTGSWVDRLPTPGNDRGEINRQKAVRNPTVLRVQNELRKVVNNLIAVYGTPDRIRVEVARAVGKSAAERAEDLSRNRKREAERKRAIADLHANGLAEPSRDDIEKWLLWKECNETCPYTGKRISFSALFADGAFQVEHIWPRWRSLDDSFGNKTLCCRDFNLKKSNRMPAEAFAHDTQAWQQALDRVRAFTGPPGRIDLKVRRFAATEIPEDFASRQLNDTGYAARQAVGFLKMLYPDQGNAGDVRVATLSGRVTARLRQAWGLNHILADDGTKTRADHRHHAIDALVAALAHPGYTNILSRWFQSRDSITPLPAPALEPPFPLPRARVQASADAIIVSHRVRRKVSGPLHKDTTYGDAGPAEGKYRLFVTRKPVEALTNALLNDDDAWPNPHIRDVLREWIASHGGDPRKAFVNGYPTVSDGGPPIRKVRILIKQQERLMAKLKNGYADLGNNHHAAVFLNAKGKPEFEISSLFAAAGRIRNGKPAVSRVPPTGGKFLFSLSAGDTIRMNGNREGLWIVRKLSANGQLTLWPINDTDAEKHKTIFEPTIGGMLKLGLEKLQVDPIGRIRKARD
ncbi:MAG: type II CRISPR RNA-guided endonuclease Cas9 [Alphaproteobacteria bacterium]|nr:type II CRISPR RNA-guided endonuclease Cas9 [Alphaproteobacteria bacterium]